MTTPRWVRKIRRYLDERWPRPYALNVVLYSEGKYRVLLSRNIAELELTAEMADEAPSNITGIPHPSGIVNIDMIRTDGRDRHGWPK